MVLRTFSGSYRGCLPAGCILVKYLPHASHTFVRLVNNGIACVRRESEAWGRVNGLETEFAPAKYPTLPSPL